ncbi:MAG: SDR family NAD(P)-dependent oxidoreductase [Sphingobium sp.]
MVDDRVAPAEACIRFPSGCAVIFGASGAIGAAVAEAFAATGVDLVLTAHSGVHELAEKWGRRALILPCDITDRASVGSVMDQARQTHDVIHSVALCHGARYEGGTVADGPLDQLRLKLDMDLFGFLHVVQAVVPIMRAQGSGAITTIVTPAIDKRSPGYGLASAPKVAVAKLVEYLALEEGANGIRVNAVAPGVLDGGVASKITAGPAAAVIRRALAQTPLGRTGSPAEVADLILFLSSLQAGYITGQIIDIDGGYSLC